MSDTAPAFIDLFAGIGGIRSGFEAAGAHCVFTSEIDPWARRTYEANYSVDHPFVGDIVGYPTEEIPEHDILLAGFPCQPFSLAGVSKKNSLGRPHGFECESQGTLFFEIERILRDKRPQAFLLENVKNLRSHDGGRTYRHIRGILETRLGYRVYDAVVDGARFVPQHRERILIAGFRDPVEFSWDELPECSPRPVLASILHPEDGTEDPDPEGRYTNSQGQVLDRYTLSPALWRYLRDYAAKHRAAGNGFGYGLVGPNDVARTLSARYHKDGSEILVSRGRRRRPRRLTPRECARLMGFDEQFRIVVSDTRAYRQFGNSVVVPLMKAAADLMLAALRGESMQTRPRQMTLTG